MFSFTVEEPVFVFAIVMAVIFFSPYIMRLVKLPEIIGVIIFGIILGPNFLNVLERDGGILLFGTVGILFIMFNSGLELDMQNFKKKKFRSLIFGLLTFIFPMSAGFLAGYGIFHFMEIENNIENGKIIAAILFGSVFASHTLLTYPTVGKLGIKDDEAVVVAVGGTLITNTIAMLILAVIASYVLGGGQGEWYDAPAIFMCFSVAVVMFIPKLVRWFFKMVESDTYTQYIFVMAVLFAVASFGKLIGIEPIIGAFLAGLALNSLIPANSILMNRIGFIGNTLFIPFFLMYVGMLADIRLLVSDWRVIMIAALMFFIAVPTKYVAAYITQKIFKYSDAQRRLIFGLSNTQAAGTLAVIMIGVHSLRLFDQILLDASILLMLVTCIISAIYTEKAARNIASKSKSAANEDENSNGTGEKILLLLSNPQTVTKLVDLSIMMKNPKNENPIFPLTLVVDGKNAKEEIDKKQKLLEQAQAHASGTNQLTHLVTRVDVNVASGVKLVSKEFSTTHMILGWNSSLSNSSKFFGTVLEHILAVSDNVIVAVKSVADWHVIQRTVLFISPNAQFENNFLSVILPILRVANSLKTAVILYGSRDQFDEIMNICSTNNINLDIFFDESTKNPIKFAKKTIKANDFSVIINGRRKSVSFDEEFVKIPNFIDSNFRKENFVVVYPSIDEKIVRNVANY